MSADAAIATAIAKGATDTINTNTNNKKENGNDDMEDVPVEEQPKITEAEATATTSGLQEEKNCVGWFGWYQFGGSGLAKGYCTLGIGRGPLIMSNIFLSTSFIFLASEEAGCLTEDGTEVADDCENRVHGFKPASLVSTIAVVSGLLAAFLMPLVGATVDFTPHRKLVGMGSAVTMILIQAAQAGTVAATWFPMAILQAIVGFIYQIQVLAVYAYLPEAAREVGENRMRKYQAHFTMTQFGAQSAFLILIIGIAYGAGLNDVQTGHVSQAVNVIWISIAFYAGWKLMPSVDSKNKLPLGQSLWTAGFKQNFRTMANIHKHYNRGLFRFLLAVVFAEASVNAFTVVAVVYLSDHIGLSGLEVGIFFLITLLASLPGALLGAFVTSRLNPVRSWQICLSCLIFVTIGGSVIVDNAPKPVAYLWGISIGVFLGWHYPTEGLIFSMCLPQGREAELSGFFVYCTQILGWAPPLVFSALVEVDVSQTYGVWSVTAFLLVAIVILQWMALWEEALAETQKADPTKVTIMGLKIENVEPEEEKGPTKTAVLDGGSAEHEA